MKSANNKWLIKLKADPSLLEQLSKESCNPELHVFHDSGCWFIDSSYLDSDDSSEIYDSGERLINYLNQMLWLHSYRADSVQSDGYHLLDTNGERRCKFQAVGRISAPTRLTVHSSDIPGRKSFDLFVRNWKVKESLALFNNADVDWATLFKIYETARDDDPDIPTTKEGIALIEQWAGVEENKRFFETANWHRHSIFGKTQGRQNKPADNPMSLVEAQRFIRDVLIAWLEYKTKRQHL